MLPITACSSTGQFCHDGSCGWQRRMRAARPAVRARPALAAPALDAADAEPPRAAAPAAARGPAPSGRPSTIARDQPQRLERSRRSAPRPGPRRRRRAWAGVAPAARRTARDGKSQRRSRGLAAGAAGEAGQPELARRARAITLAGGEEAVLQAGVLVVDRRAACATSRSQRVALAARCAAACVAVEVARDAAGDDAVHQQPVAERRADRRAASPP